MDTHHLYQLAATLGLTPTEVDAIITNPQPIHPSLSLGPPHYPGGHYGTFSIHDYPG